jgi:hypothetical protein
MLIEEALMFISTEQIPITLIDSPPLRKAADFKIKAEQPVIAHENLEISTSPNAKIASNHLSKIPSISRLPIPSYRLEKTQ